MCGLGLVPLSFPSGLAVDWSAVAAEPAVAVDLAVVRLKQGLMCGLGLVPLSYPLELAVELAAEPAVLQAGRQEHLAVGKHYKTTGC